MVGLSPRESILPLGVWWTAAAAYFRALTLIESEVFLWRAQELPSPVPYPAKQSSAIGRIIINDENAVNFDMASADTEGCIVLYFSPMDVTDLRIEFNEETAVGEIFVIGKNISAQ